MIVIIDKMPMITKVHKVASATSLRVKFLSDSLIWIDDLKMPGIRLARCLYYCFSIEKLLNLKKILGENNFNVLIFYNEFRKNPEFIEDVLGNLSKFSNSQIIRDY